MALTALAVAADLPAAWQDHADAARAIAVASAAVRDAAGASITEETSTVVVTGGPGNLLGLPGPVTAVSAVLIDGEAIAATDYEVLPNGLWRHCGWERRSTAYARAPVPVTVTYTHGVGAVPDDIKDLVCQLAIAWLNHMTDGGGSTAGLTSARIDDAAETYSDESAGQVSPVYIPQVTRNWLAARFGGGAVVVETL